MLPMKSSLAVLGAAFSLLLSAQVAVAASTGTSHRAPAHHGSTAASAVPHRPAHAVAHPKKKKHRVKKTAHQQRAPGHGQAGKKASSLGSSKQHVARHAKTKGVAKSSKAKTAHAGHGQHHAAVTPAVHAKKMLGASRPRKAASTVAHAHAKRGAVAHPRPHA